MLRKRATNVHNYAHLTLISNYTTLWKLQNLFQQFTTEWQRQKCHSLNKFNAVMKHVTSYVTANVQNDLLVHKHRHQVSADMLINLCHSSAMSCIGSLVDSFLRFYPNAW